VYKVYFLFNYVLLVIADIQKMLDICSNQAADIDIVFNAKKSILFAVGKLFDCNLLNLHPGSDVISWSEPEVPWLVY